MQLYKRILTCLFLLLFPMIASARIVYVAGPTSADDAAIYVMDDDGSNRTLVYDGKPDIYEVRWSPDGQIAFLARADLYLMNPDATNIQRLTSPDLKGSIGSFSFSPDGQQIMFDLRQAIDQGNVVRRVTSIQILDVQTRKITKIIDDIPAGAGDLDWSPDGKNVLFSTPILLGGPKLGNSIYIMDAFGRNVKELLAPGRGRIEHCQMEPEMVTGWHTIRI